jgi:tetratricopeptide (TPR) repeat protein
MDRARFRLLDAVSSLLVRAAADGPLCVVLDDLQWADASSLLLLGFLARQLSGSALVIIGCYRDTEVGPGHLLRGLRAGVGLDTELVELGGLDQRAVARLITRLSSIDAGAGLVAQVYGRTAGNPFFVREVIRLMSARGALPHVEGRPAGIPDGVRQVVEHRLARLPQACARLLAAAAVAGQEVSSGVLVRSTRFAAGTVAELAEIAVRAGVLAEPVAASGPYRFCHDLFRETVYDGLDPTGRAVLHQRVGEALEQLRGGGQVGAAELAHHFLLAALGAGEGVVPDGDTALRYCVAAGVEASARLAYEDAVGHYRRALDGLGGAGLLGEQSRLALPLGRADALRRVGDGHAARQDYLQVTALARRSGQPVEVARAALGVQALGVESGASRDGCITLLEDALDLLPEQDSVLNAQVLAGLAREVYLSGADQRERATGLSAAAVQIAGRVGDDATLAMCLLAEHDTLWRPGTAARRHVIATEMAACARRAGDRGFEAEAWLLRASAGLELGDPAALVDLDEFVRLGTAVGEPHHTYLVLTRRATRAILVGEFTQAERLITEAGELAEAIGEPDAWNVQTRLWWELRSAQGRRGETEAQLRSVSLPHLKFWYQALLGLALLERGEPDEAIRAIGPAVQVRPELLPFPYVVAAQWAELGQAAAAAGLLEACARYYDVLLPLAGTTVVIAAAVGFGGAVDHHLGVLAAALGHHDRAVEHFERAASVHERLGARPWLALRRSSWPPRCTAEGWRRIGSGSRSWSNGPVGPRSSWGWPTSRCGCRNSRSRR